MPRKKQNTEEAFIAAHAAKPVYRNNPLQASPDADANSKAIQNALFYFNLPDIDLHDEQAVKERISLFYSKQEQDGIKPNVTGLAGALGINRKALWAIVAGCTDNGHYPQKINNLPAGTTDLIKKAYDFLEQMWEISMQTGKINPVAGIFIAKNHYNYQDRQDVVLTPQTETPDAATIRDKYLQSTAEVPSDLND